MAAVERAVFITGAGHGMGRAHSHELARGGMLVGVVDVDEVAARRVADEITTDGGAALALTCDVSMRQEVEEMVARFVEWAGRIDVLVSNAGNTDSNELLADTDDENWKRTFAIHVDGALHTSRACLPYIEKSPSGRIIIISSIWGQVGIGHSYAYCAAKGALIAFAKNLAKELGPKGISVNSVAPGGVYTRMCEELTEQELAEDFKTIPLGRYADPSEISHLVAFLASPESAFLTGQTISINGGQVISGI